MVIAGVLVAVAPWADLNLTTLKWVELVLGVVLIIHGLFGAKCMCMKKMCATCGVDVSQGAKMPQ